MIENFLWVEKYRPKNISDYIFSDISLKKSVLQWVQEKNIPHLLVYGPAGTGKTSLVKVLLNELDIIDDFIYLNASNENGVDIIREKVIEYAPQIPNRSKFKVIVLDESDYLTVQSQNSLKDTIERYSDICRFIFITNTKSKIISPIVSRCQELHINKLSEKEVVEKIIYILKSEQILFTPEILIEYIKKFYPDFRKIINSIQQNSNNKQLNKLTIGSSNREALYLELFENYKNNDLNYARKKLIEELSISEYNEFYLWMGKKINKITSDPRKSLEILSIIKDAIADIPLSLDPEIALSGTIAKILLILKQS